MFAAGRFKAKLKKWYKFSDERADQEWASALRDSSVKKQRDQFGNLEVAKLVTTVASDGRVTQSKRELREERVRPVDTREEVAELGRGQRDLGIWICTGSAPLPSAPSFPLPDPLVVPAGICMRPAVFDFGC